MPPIGRIYHHVMPSPAHGSVNRAPVSAWRFLMRSRAAVAGLATLAVVGLACFGTLVWAMAPGAAGVPRYSQGRTEESRLPPRWCAPTPDQARRFNALVPEADVRAIAARHGAHPRDVAALTEGPAAGDLRRHWPAWLLGTDALGRSVLIRLLAGGGISLAVGMAAALVSVTIGTLYGALAGYAGGRTDALMMRFVDVLYGLPYILLVVLLAVAGDAGVARLERWSGSELSGGWRMAVDVALLLAAIGGVSWLTMARVIRGQVLSLKATPFVEAARALGASPARVFFRHLLPNMTGPIIVYATLTVPQAILQESFLSFLGIGIKPPLPSWGNLAADGMSELNPFESNWWLLAFPCGLLGLTLLALNFVGESLREAMDPRRSGGRA